MALLAISRSIARLPPACLPPFIEKAPAMGPVTLGGHTTINGQAEIQNHGLSSPERARPDWPDAPALLSRTINLNGSLIAFCQSAEQQAGDYRHEGTFYANSS
jgi:hypothetical protein